MSGDAPFGRAVAALLAYDIDFFAQFWKDATCWETRSHGPSLVRQVVHLVFPRTRTRPAATSLGRQYWWAKNTQGMPKAGQVAYCERVTAAGSTWSLSCCPCVDLCRDMHLSGRIMRISTPGACTTGSMCVLPLAYLHDGLQSRWNACHQRHLCDQGSQAQHATHLRLLSTEHDLVNHSSGLQGPEGWQHNLGQLAGAGDLHISNSVAVSGAVRRQWGPQNLALLSQGIFLNPCNVLILWKVSAFAD